MTNDKHIIFIHIPKAAGRTMHSILARQYARDELLAIEGRLGMTREPAPEDVQRARVIIGLVHYGLHRDVPGRSVYVTVLRDPVRRVLSLYRYIASNPNHYLHRKVADRGLAEFVSGELDTEEVENGQTRQIAGVTEGSPDTRSLERAKRNLADSFAAIGLVERFDETVILFKRRFGWRLPLYVPKNVTPSRDNGKALNEAIALIRSRNDLDIELYEFGRRLFEEQLLREGRLFQLEVSAFRLLNRGARAYRSARGLIRHSPRRVSPDILD